MLRNRRGDTSTSLGARSSQRHNHHNSPLNALSSIDGISVRIRRKTNPLLPPPREEVTRPLCGQRYQPCFM